MTQRFSQDILHKISFQRNKIQIFRTNYSESQNKILIIFERRLHYRKHLLVNNIRKKPLKRGYVDNFSFDYDKDKLHINCNRTCTMDCNCVCELLLEKKGHFAARGMAASVSN